VGLCIATHLNALQRTATHCNALQRTATHCNTLQRTATHWDYVCRRAVTHEDDGQVFKFKKTIKLQTCLKFGHLTRHSHFPTATHCNTLQHAVWATYKLLKTVKLRTCFKFGHLTRHSMFSLQLTAIHCNMQCKQVYKATYNLQVTMSILFSHCNTLQNTTTSSVGSLHVKSYKDNPMFSLHNTAIHCNMLQHTATHFNTPQHTATRCNVQRQSHVLTA